MANLITLGRLLLLFALVGMAYWAAPVWQLANPPLVLLIIALDGVDGWVARRRGETSLFGSIFDIAVDRVVETVLWIVLGHLGLIPIWVAIVFVVRGGIVDSIRHAAAARGETAFALPRRRLARTLVAGRTMRGLYGVVKALTFAWVLLLQPWPHLDPASWAQWQAPTNAVTLLLVMTSVLLCVLRGAPVITEFLAEQKVFARAPVSAQGG